MDLYGLHKNLDPGVQKLPESNKKVLRIWQKKCKIFFYSDLNESKSTYVSQNNLNHQHVIFLFNQSWFKNELLSGIHMGYESLLAISRFIISAQLAILITRLRMFPVFQGFYKLLATLGQNSLLIFILHRPFCHLVGGILGKTVENQYIVVLIGAAMTMGIMWSICQLRKKFEFMHTGLAKIGF